MAPFYLSTLPIESPALPNNKIVSVQLSHTTTQLRPPSHRIRTLHSKTKQKMKLSNRPSVHPPKLRPSQIQIYDIRLKSYRTALEEFQPSWDGIVQTRRGPRGPATAAEYVARDLDDLNGHFEELVDALQRRLQLLCDMAQQELDDFEVMSDFYFIFLLFLFSFFSRLL